MELEEMMTGIIFSKSDQLKGGEDALTINELGDAAQNYPDFEEGIDFLDGINETHDIVY